jgi:hypothetical protein
VTRPDLSRAFGDFTVVFGEVVRLAVDKAVLRYAEIRP